MDIMQLGAIGELVGGVAVIGSLLFVDVQIRQSNQQSREMAMRDLSLQFDRWSEMILRNPDLREVWRRATNDATLHNLRNPSGLSADDAASLSILLYRAFHGFSSQHKAWRSGALTDDEWAEVIPLVQVHLASDIALDWWNWARTGWYNAPFTEFVEEQIKLLPREEN